MSKKLIVAVLMLTVSCSIALARGTACENSCALHYSNQIETCKELYGPDGNIPDPARLQQCLTLIEDIYWQCMNNCIGE